MAGDSRTLTLHDGLIIAKAANTKIGFDPLADLAPVDLVGQSATVLVVKKDSPFKTFDEMVRHAKANSGKLNFGGNGTSLHFALERLNADLRSVGVAPEQLTSAQYETRLKAEVAQIDDLMRKFNIKLD